jgi:hypothetical protein
MQKSHRILIGAVAAAAALAGTITMASASGPNASPLNALTIDGSGTSPILGAGQSVAFSGTDVTVTATTTSVQTAAGTFVVTVTPPTGGTFAAGTFGTLTTADATHYGLTVTSTGHTCAAPGAGTITINNDLDPADGSAAPDVFSASYSTTCGSDPSTLSGQIRFNSAVGYVGATESPTTSDFGTVDVLQDSNTHTVTVSSVGTDPIVFGQATIGGAQPDSFRIGTDNCSGKSIAGGSTCTVTVIANPTQIAPSLATLTIPDNTVLGSRVVALKVSGKIGSAGSFYPIAPARILDTRIGLGAPKKALGAKGVLHLQVSGRGGVPTSGVSAVVLNVTETGATTGGFITAYPTGVTRPNASNLNFPAGRTEANSVTVKLGTNGQVDIYNNAGSTNVIADVSGYFVGSDSIAPGGEYQPFDPPIRLLDTRATGGGGPLSFDQFLVAGLDFNGGGTDVNAHIKAYAVNITAVGPTASGFLTAWDGGPNDIPSTSTLNFPKGATVPNMAIVPTAPCDVSICQGTTGDDPFIGVLNGAHGNVNVIIDVVGVFDDGTLGDGFRFQPMTPTRIVDSRIGQGVPNSLGPKEADVITPPSTVANLDTGALALNVTAVGPTSSTFLTLWPDGEARPTVSTLNPAAKQTVPNAAITTLSLAEKFDVFNNAGTTNLVIDVAGAYQFYPFTISGTIPSAASGVGPKGLLQRGTPAQVTSVFHGHIG